MDAIHIRYAKTRIGEMLLASFRGRLCMMDFRWRRMRTTIDRRVRSMLGAEAVERDDETLLAAEAQLNEYLDGARTAFELPLHPVGTDFQRQVWRALMDVPYGGTSTYAALARSIGRESAVRAVAAANGANAISVIIPCHRIIGADGSLVGYGGGLQVKKRLLRLESARRGA